MTNPMPESVVYEMTIDELEYKLKLSEIRNYKLAEYLTKHQEYDNCPSEQYGVCPLGKSIEVWDESTDQWKDETEPCDAPITQCLICWMLYADSVPQTDLQKSAMEEKNKNEKE